MSLCPYCSKKISSHVTARDINNRVNDRPFTYDVCADCGLISLNAIPPDLSKFYENDYAPYKMPNSIKELRNNLDPIRFRLEIVREFKLGGKLLEIGPSYGGFALLAKDAGFEVEAIEMDPKCCQFLTNEIGIRVIESTDVGAALAKLGSYDVITMWHNIEHLHEPWHLLRILPQHLNPGGLLVIATPNPESFQFQCLKGYWTHLDAPRHLTLMPKRWIRDILGYAKLEEEPFSTRDIDSLGITRTGWSASFKAWARGREPFLFLARVFGRILGATLAPFEKAERAAAYTLTFRKMSEHKGT